MFSALHSACRQVTPPRLLHEQVFNVRRFPRM